MTARVRGRRMAEVAADRLIERYGISQAPVDVEGLAQQLGAAIQRQPFNKDRDVSGLLLRMPGKPPVIGVNKANVPVRQRFTTAHELGHLQLHDGKELILDRLVRVNFRNAASTTATDLEEREANAFAAALLMPEALVARELAQQIQGSHRRDNVLVNDVAAVFEVSAIAMKYRMINLGLMSPE